MSKLATVLLFVLIVPGLAIIVAVVVRLLLKGTKPSSRETPSAREEEERQSGA
jgi:hypothetical protein